MLQANLLHLAQDVRPAGGAALDQVLIATGGATVLTTALLLLGYGHRTGRSTALARAAAWAERGALSRGLPGWAALPQVVGFASLITALLGMYWDISLHIGLGRDEGPLANPAHYPILFGLFGLFTAGVLALVLPRDERPGPAAVRITRDWYAPVGGVLLAGAGFYALLGFPLDDVWHRLFGQDVTLWGPTHLMLIGGAGLSLVALAVLEREGRLARPDAAADPRRLYLRRGMVMGGLLIGLSVFQAEWDFGVPQFRMVHQPLLIALAAGCALVAARLWVGRGAAVFAVGFYVLVRGGVAVVVGPGLGELTAYVPLYLAEAVLVEIAALALIRRPLLFGVVSGALIGTVGFAAEYAWTQVAMPLPWTPDMVTEGVAMALVGGIAGGLAGALLVTGLQGRLARPALARTAFAGLLAAVAVAVTNGLLLTVPPDVTAAVTLSDERGDATNRTAQATFQLSPADAVDDPTWVTVTGWQGSGLHVDHLEPLGDGAYRTTKPMPLHGDWKTVLRLHDGRELSAVAIYLPADAAIGAEEVPAPTTFERPAIKEQTLLQRELNQDIPGWLWAVASAVVLVCTLALVLALGWGASRVSRAAPGRPARTDRSPVMS